MLLRLLALVAALLAPSIASAAVMTTVPATSTTPAVPIYIVRPDGAGPFPTVVILHGCEGFNGFAAVAADRLVALGYAAVAIDGFGPKYPHGACDSTEDAAYLAEVTAAQTTFAWLHSQPFVIPDRLAGIGFSSGADVLLALIDSKAGNTTPLGLRAAVAYYPSCEERPANVRVPLAIFDGDADRITPAGPCAALTKAATTAGQSVQITTYQGATHGFVVPAPDRTLDGQPIRFDAEAAADAARQTAAFLQRYLDEPPPEAKPAR